MAESRGPLSVPMSKQVACSQASSTRAADIARGHVHFGLRKLQHPSTLPSVQLPTVSWMSVLCRDKEGPHSLTTPDSSPREPGGYGTLPAHELFLVFHRIPLGLLTIPEIILPHARIPCARNSSPTSPSQPANAQLHLRSSSYSLPRGVLTPPSLLCPTISILSLP